MIWGQVMWRTLQSACLSLHLHVYLLRSAPPATFRTITTLPFVQWIAKKQTRIPAPQITAEALAPGAAALVLDTRDLTVSAVELLPGKTPLAFSLGAPHKVRWGALDCSDSRPRAACWLQMCYQSSCITTHKQLGRNPCSNPNPPARRRSARR